MSSEKLNPILDIKEELETDESIVNYQLYQFYPEFRGKGLGASIVKSAFARIDANQYHFCIFQMGVPRFYEKLGCKVIENKIINSNNQEDPNANPFWEEYAMIYPATFLWSSGTIDLLRPGF